MLKINKIQCKKSISATSQIFNVKTKNHKRCNILSDSLTYENIASALEFVERWSRPMLDTQWNMIDIDACLYMHEKKLTIRFSPYLPVRLTPPFLPGFAG